jgi:hypothetical protein
MSDRQQGSVGGEAQRRRLRDNAGLLASGLAHTLLLLGIVVIGSPRLFATPAPQAIVVEIVRPEEVAKGELRETPPTKQAEAQPQAQPQKQAQAQQPEQPVQPEQKAQPQAQTQQQPSQQRQAPVKVASAAPATPVFTSLYPWPVGQPGGDVQDGDHRTFESMGKLEHNELARFKARLKECWHPPAAGPKVRATLRVALRVDGGLAGSPELVEVSASPDAVALVTSAKQALAECGPYGFLPADSYDTWRSLSLTFSPEDIAVAAVTK